LVKEPPPHRIPVASPDLSGNEEAYVSDAVRSSWISSTGPYVSRFEHEFAAVCETTAAVSVANGTVALHLALVALGVGPGDEVIIPSLTYIATANAARYVGATPVFVDVDPDTWCIDPSAVEAAVNDRTRAIIAVHLYGHPADMDALNEIASRSGAAVVEDAAEAHFAHYRGRPTGGLGRVGTFSFYGNKIITSGEGGALTTSDAELESRIRLFRGQGMDPERRYFFPVVGYNYRLTNLACAILCAQLERRESTVGRRSEIHQRYDDLLHGIPGIGFQPVASWADPACWLYSITVDPAAYGRSRDELSILLDGDGIETRPFFVPIHSLPPYSDGTPSTLVHTDRIAAMGMNLPTYNAISDADLERVAGRIRHHQG
jgi:perosamine synthetase